MAQRPNIVFILIDDMGWRDLSCYGSGFYETPHIDLLARQGMRFTDAYAACPVCSPTRASLLTGQYPARLQVTDWIGSNARGRLLEAPYIHHLPDGQTTVAAALGEGGYQTWHVGKWHLGGSDYFPDRVGFDVNVGGCSWGAPKHGYFSPWGIETLSDGPAGQDLTDRLTDEAIGLIRSRDRSRPFFLNLWHYAVHTPLQGKAHLVEKYRAKARMLGLDGVDPFEYGEHFPSEHKAHLRLTRRLFQSDPVYAAMVQNLDDNVGRLMAALAAEGLDEDTVVIFTSDNGGLATSEGSPTCNAPLAEGKGWMYEGGTREPMIVRWPGTVAPDSTCAAPVTSPDLYPTLLDIAELPPRPAQHCDGVSMLGLLKGAGQLDREGIFWHYPHYGNQGGTPGCSVRAGDYKLIEFFEDNRVELYNLRQDVSEQHDLSGSKPQRVQRMRAMLHQWLDQAGAILPTPNPDYRGRS